MSDMMTLRKLWIKWQIKTGRAINIWSRNPYPANVLSNLNSNGFRFDGRVCGSMEGFLQSLKHKDADKQRQICSMKGGNAKKMSTEAWKTDQVVWWKGRAMDRQGETYQQLLRQAYRAMFEQNERFRRALMDTRGKKLYHLKGKKNPYETILTEHELCSILTEIREEYDQLPKTDQKRKERLFVQVDHALLDFAPVFLQLDDKEQQIFKDHMENVPCHLQDVQSKAGAIEALEQLAGDFDIYYLLPSPLHAPHTPAEYAQWLTNHLGKEAAQHLVFTNCKETLQGKYMIGTKNRKTDHNFEGVIMELASKDFPDWPALTEALQKLYREN